MSVNLVIDPELIRKYGGRGPRYTSYPTADRFVEAFDAAAYEHWLRHRSIGGVSRPLSLYVHHPFCDTICYYCACNKIVTKHDKEADGYLDSLFREIRLVSDRLGTDRTIQSMHWGGGTPTFMGMERLGRLMQVLRTEFTLDPAGEYAIELDPRKVDAAGVAALRELGFNRTSLGVQDFNIDVQRAVNRVQSVEQTMAVIRAARSSGFKSVNVDLIYGLPRQNVEGFARTLDLVIEADPDRIALYGYAHLPALFKPQRRILDADMPTPEVKLELFILAIRRLQDAGYVYIGMDHFAKPADDLALAQRQGRLQRDFQGYTATGDGDTIGLGVSSIGSIGPAYIQNTRELDDYRSALDQGVLPVLRGMELSPDDLLRRAVIRSLACSFVVSKESIAISHLIDFDEYFKPELESLKALEEDGLVELDDKWITVTPRGRLLVRSVCMVFDRYLRAGQERERYSRVV